MKLFTPIDAAIGGAALALMLLGLAAVGNSATNPPNPLGTAGPGFVVLPSDGLGDAGPTQIAGQVQRANWVFNPGCSVEVWMLTGDAPEPYGTFVVDLPNWCYPIDPTTGVHVRPLLAGATMNWTRVEYAAGYTRHEPPIDAKLFMMDVGDGSDLKANTAMICYRTFGLQPRSTYAVVLTFAEKPNGPPVNNQAGK
jgi:hypothetical protein